MVCFSPNVDQQTLVDQFVEQYWNQLPAGAQQCILDYRKSDHNRYLNDLMAQVYAMAGILPDEYNRYFGFYQVAQQYNMLYGSMLEIGGGCFPVFSQYVASSLTLQQEMITIYDPNLVMLNNCSKHMQLKKEYFVMDHCTDDYSAIFCFAPCHYLEKAIRLIGHHDGPGLIVACECDHENNETRIVDWLERYNIYRKEIICEDIVDYGYKPKIYGYLSR